MTPASAIVASRAPRGDDASPPNVIADLIQAALRTAETRSFKLQDDGRADGEPDPGRDRRRPPPQSTLLAPWRAKKLDRFIEENLDRKLNTEILAPLVRLSCSHFARACRNTFGLPPRELVIRRRVERAQALMRETRTPLSQVALACGFADQAHFSRLFRRVVGTPPRQWRRDNLAPSSH
jgi:transcriptional regulator GlxA family with amidase domain